MPTAAQYTAWAVEFGGLADDLTGGLPAVLTAWESGPVVGGNLAIVVHRGVEASIDHVAAIDLGLDDLAAECTRRAGVCDDYTAALASYDVAWARYLDELDAYNPYADGASYFVLPPAPPPRPARPAPWADAG